VAGLRFAVSMICQVLLAGLAFAQGSAKPSQVEIAAIKTCLDGGGRDTSYRDCVGKAVVVCLATYLTGGVVYACQQREIAIWDDLLNAHYDELRRHLPPRQLERLRGVQRAWIAYVDRKCAFPDVGSSGSNSRFKYVKGCRLEETARRMSELRGLREWAAQRHWLNE
jgi:uncharacterized protein YecT (DUF1311 family)